MNKGKIVSALILASLMVNMANAKLNQLSDVELQEIKKTNKLLQRSNIRILDGVDEGKSYFLQLEVKNNRGSKIINGYIEKETKHLYTGSRYNINGMKSMYPKTEKSIETIKKGVSFSYGSGANELYILTDPECPYCKKFEKEVKGKLDNYTVHVILFPLSFHKKAPAMVEWIMQGKDDMDRKYRMENMMVNNAKEYEVLLTGKGQPFKYSDATRAIVQKAKLAAKALNATGTPSVYDEQFNKIDSNNLIEVNPFKAVKPLRGCRVPK